MSPSPSKSAERSTAGGSGNKTGRSELDYLRNGRSQALARFSKEHAARIMGWAIRLGPPELDPQAVARRVFSTVLSQLDAQPDKLPAKVWIYRITKKTILSQSRGSTGMTRRWMVWKKTEKQTKSTSRGEENPRRRAVQVVLQALPLPEREALVLVDMEDFSLAEAAIMMGSRSNDVAKLLQQARVRFAREASKQGLQAPARRSSTKRTRR